MWVRVDDNKDSWEYYQNGCLWFGDPPDCMRKYPPPCDAWSEAEWRAAKFDGRLYMPNHIYLED